MQDLDRNIEPKVGDEIVFYGSLMRGLGALDALPSRNQLRYSGPCKIAGALYDLGSYPGVCIQAATETDIVHAELHAILDRCVIEELDHFEGYEPDQPEDSLYLRQRIPLLSPLSVSQTTKQAWVYIYNHTPDPSQRVDSGDWRAHLLARPHDSPLSSRKNEEQPS